MVAGRRSATDVPIDTRIFDYLTDLDLKGMVFHRMIVTCRCPHLQELVISAVAAALLLYSARGAVPQDYNYPVLWNPSTIVTSNISYTDGPAKLKVRCAAWTLLWLREQVVGPVLLAS